MPSRSRLSTARSSSATLNSTRPSRASVRPSYRTGPIRSTSARARWTTGSAGEPSTSRTRPGTTWKSSPRTRCLLAAEPGAGQGRELAAEPSARRLSRARGGSAGHVEVGDHLDRPDPDHQLAGHPVALAELPGPLRAHVPTADLGRRADQVVDFLAG